MCANPGGNSPDSEAAANLLPIAAATVVDEGGDAAPEMEMEHDEFRMLLLKGLMRWFKTEFFTWCGAATST